MTATDLAAAADKMISGVTGSGQTMSLGDCCHACSISQKPAMNWAAVIDGGTCAM